MTFDLKKWREEWEVEKKRRREMGQKRAVADGKDAVASYPCPRCRQKPGSECRVTAGYPERPTKWKCRVHKERLDLLRAERLIGYYKECSKR